MKPEDKWGPNNRKRLNRTAMTRLEVKQWKGENEGMSLEDCGSVEGDGRPGTPSDD